MSQYKYSVKKEDKKDKINSIILKENVEVEFTLSDLLNSKNTFDKKFEELKGSLVISEAQKQNIINNNPDLFADGVLIATEDEVKRAIAIALFHEFSTNTNKIKEEIKKYEEALKGYEQELKHIKEQTGLELPKNNDKK